MVLITFPKDVSHLFFIQFRKGSPDHNANNKPGLEGCVCSLVYACACTYAHVHTNTHTHTRACNNTNRRETGYMLEHESGA